MDRARQGLAFAKNARKLGLMADVRVLFFGPVVQLLDPRDMNYPQVESSLKELSRYQGNFSGEHLSQEIYPTLS